MPHYFPGFIGLIVLAAIALKTIEGGGDWFDFLSGSARYEAARTNFDFNLMFIMIVGFVIAIIGFAVYKAQVEEPTPAYQAESQPAPAAQHKVRSDNQSFFEPTDSRVRSCRRFL